MLPVQHAASSLAVSVIYVGGSTLVLHKTETLVNGVIIIATATILGVLVDIDHLVWALVMNFRMTLSFVFKFNIRGLYRELITPEGYFYRREVAFNEKHPRIFFFFHGTWMCIAGGLLFLALGGTALYRDYLPFLWIVLALHFIADLIYWRTP